ncbi:MAG: hypothetical protein ACTSRZ_03630 [Promethearchaeota archaeon]
MNQPSSSNEIKQLNLENKKQKKRMKLDLEKEKLNAELSYKLIQRPGTSRRIGILRLDYLFSVIVPILMAIYLNNLSLVKYLDIIFGFFLYGITGNTLNDAIDMNDPNDIETKKRTEGYHQKELISVSIISFLFGSMFFLRTISQHLINGVILICIIALVVIYCLKKNIPIINQILLGISHILLPYIIIKIDAGFNPIMTSGEWFIMICIFAYAYAGQIVHEIIDGDSVSKFPLRVQQRIVIFSSLISIFIGIIALIVLKNIYLIPFAVIPAGAIYTFRKPTRSRKGVKDVGIIMGNIILVYLVVLIIMQNSGIY